MAEIPETSWRPTSYQSDGLGQAAMFEAVVDGGLPKWADEVVVAHRLPRVLSEVAPIA